MYKVYILYSSDYDKIYIGFTANLESRLISHNEFGIKGWTIKFRPWKLIYTEEYDDKKEAIMREKQLKSGRGREWIWKELILKL